MLFTAHNRLAFTRASFEALVQNTNWQLVNRLIVTDDRSRDGTYEHLAAQIGCAPVPALLISERFGGPVAAMNCAFNRTQADAVAKIDNDVIVCPGWLEEMSLVLAANPTLDVLGMEPGFGEIYQGHPHGLRTWTHARWVGGVGLIRTRIFTRRRQLKMNDRWFGWTAFQRRYCRSAWITPDLPTFLLDHIPVEPWRTLAQKYIAKGWARHWDTYHEPGPAYYSWWLEQQAAAA